MRVIIGEYDMTYSKKLGAVVAIGFVCLLGFHSSTANASSGNKDDFLGEAKRRFYAIQNNPDNTAEEYNDVSNPKQPLQPNHHPFSLLSRICNVLQNWAYPRHQHIQQLRGSPDTSEMTLVLLPNEMLTYLFAYLDPQSLAKTRRACSLLKSCADDVLESYKKSANKGNESSQRWLFTAYEQGNPRALSWLHNTVLAYQQGDTSAEAIAHKAFTDGKDYAVLMLFDKFGDERKNKLKALLKNQDIITEEMYDTEVAIVVSSVARVKALDRASFVADCKSLITDQMTGDEVECVVGLVADVYEYEEEEGEDRVSFVAHCKSLISEEMTGDEVAELVSDVAKVAAGDRASFVADCKSLITEEMTGDEVAMVVSSVAGVKAKDRASFMAHCQSLITEKMTGYEVAMVVSSVAGVKALDRASFIAHCKSLITEQMTGDEVASVVRAATGT